MKHLDVVEDLLSIIYRQEKVIERLNRKIKHIEQYIDVYEEYIRKEELDNEHPGTSRDIDEK